MLPPKPTNDGDPKPVDKRCPACSALVEKTVLGIDSTTVVVQWQCQKFEDHNGIDNIPRQEYRNRG